MEYAILSGASFCYKGPPHWQRKNLEMGMVSQFSQWVIIFKDNFVKNIRSNVALCSNFSFFQR